MKARTLKVSISGVRGVVGDSLTPGLLVRFAEAYGSYVGPGPIVIGRDTRTSGEMVKHAVLSGLMSVGRAVVDLDIVPVPTVQWMVRHLRAAGGIAITASHNPVEWNALKFIRGDGCFLNTYEAREMIDIYHQGEYRKAAGRDLKPPRHNTTAIEHHINAILEAFGPLPKDRPAPRVVVDCVNGAGSLMSPELLRRLGCKVFPIHDTPDGRFPRPPEPLPQNLGALCQAVVKHRADIGFAQDADADRLAIVDERGQPIGEDYTLVLAVDRITRRERGPIVVNLATTLAVDDIAARHRCPVIKTRIGEINVTETMQRHNAVIGGEGNGGVIYPRVNLARDSFVGMAIVLHHLVDRAKPLSRIVAALPRYSMTKKTVPCPTGRAQEVVEFLIEKYRRDNLDLAEGVKRSTPDGWVLVRPSNTEPILRIISEAADQKTADGLNAELESEVRIFLGKT